MSDKKDGAEQKEVEETAPRVNAIKHPSGGPGNTPRVEEIPVGSPRLVPGPNRRGEIVEKSGRVVPAPPAE